ncbi:MAG: hypothetical protein LBC84_02495 [Prevotellaceae bacterium]|nr:hypothetical protein [Prevotellaceae bacterium]
MKRLLLFLPVAALCLSACVAISTLDQMLYITAKDSRSGKVVTKLEFPPEGGAQTLYIETTLPKWMAWPLSLGPIFTHPLPGDPEYKNGVVTFVNEDRWMTISYSHKKIGVFNGYVTVTVLPNKEAFERSDVIHVWNDDIPAAVDRGIDIKVVQEFEP